MKHPVKAPSVGESVTEVSILKWAKNPGDFVKTGDLLLEIESDKATVEVVAETTGQLEVLKAAGDRIPIGEIVATIDDSVKTGASAAPVATAASAAPAPKAPIATSGAMPAGATPGPAARKMLDEVGVAASQVPGTGKEGRPTKGDVMAYMERGAALAAASPSSAATPAPSPASTSSAPPAASRAPTQIDRPGDRRVKMSMLRQKIAERLVHAQHTAAILTTFNEVDMSAVMALRAKYKDAFKAKYGVGLGFMSFFGRACVEALKQIPAVNGSIDGTDIIYHDYVDLGVAVGTERGLVVPVMRNAEKLGFAGIEGAIADFGARAKVGKLSIQELSGGTFTISNGGTYGSLLSTPILNPPQSGILGMHKIQERPVVVNGKIEVRPMMYLALSYDHRIIDGKEAVTFLVTVKDLLENPEKLGLEFVNELGKL